MEAAHRPAIVAALRAMVIVQAALAASASRSGAALLAVANPSFESPTYNDGGFELGVSRAKQGAHGWDLTGNARITNPLESDYALANFNGTPSGGHGAQVGTLYGAGAESISQRLAGPDSVLGNADDPVLFPGTIFTLTVAIGQRFAGNPLTTWGGYDIQLLAGVGLSQQIIGREINAVTPTPGSFVTRTLVVDCSATIHRTSLFGQPLTIRLSKTLVSPIATTEFDNVRLDATKISHRLDADFDELGAVNAADFARWKSHFGATCMDATHAHGNADADADVDGHDFLRWQRQLGNAVPASASDAGESSVPEPASARLAAWGVIGALTHRRRRR